MGGASDVSSASAGRCAGLLAGGLLYADRSVRLVTVEREPLAVVEPAQAEEVPLPQRLMPHGLRRTHASILAALGEEPRYVRAQIGHTDAPFTLRSTRTRYDETTASGIGCAAS